MGNDTLKHIHYRVSGPEEAPVVVFHHGIGLNHNTFKRQLKVLSKQYRVVLWDLPGHGLSAQAPLGSRFSTTATEDLISILDELHVPSAVLVGQSLGSLVVQHAASKYPHRVTATVHLGGTPLHPGYPSIYKYLIGPFLSLAHLIPPRMFYRSFASHRGILPETKAYLEEAVAQNGKKLVMRVTLDTLNDIVDQNPPQLKPPLLIVVGDKEVGFVQKGARKWHARIPGSEFQIIPNAGHIANQDNPEGFNRVLLDFLERIELSHR